MLMNVHEAWSELGKKLFSFYRNSLQTTTATCDIRSSVVHLGHLIIHDGAGTVHAHSHIALANKKKFFTIKPNSQFYVND